MNIKCQVSTRSQIYVYADCHSLLFILSLSAPLRKQQHILYPFLLQVLVPQVEKMCMDKGLTDESEILRFLQHGTLGKNSIITVLKSVMYRERTGLQG